MKDSPHALLGSKFAVGWMKPTLLAVGLLAMLYAGNKLTAALGFKIPFAEGAAERGRPEQLDFRAKGNSLVE